MNITKHGAGCATSDHILNSGFTIYSETTHQDIDSTFTLTEYIKPGKFLLTGGYWTWYIKDVNGNTIWQGWWNSNEEFDQTIKELENKI